MIIKQALIMAAGQATRMRPLTDTLPKPLLSVGGISILRHIINHLTAEGVTKIIVNGYHAINALENYIDDIQQHYPSIEFILSREDILLETGGGAVKALDYLDKTEPFYMINGDAFWINGHSTKSLAALTRAWDENKHDILLLLQSTSSMNLTDAVGDYDLNDAIATRSHSQKDAYMFTGVRICTPRILNAYTLERFSFLKIMDDCEFKNRLGGLEHDGEWFHISTPQDLTDVNNYIKLKADS
jgi:N-acetyl-alpha-D-muramate 1-phosphate uridylyltransferase